MSTHEPSPAFIDWWFAPWRNGGPALPDICMSELARRDTYRHWCKQAAVVPQLPSHADWHWQAVAEMDGDILLLSAELFGGLLAARRQRHDELLELSPSRRRWCLAVALTQPLVDWSDAAMPVPSPRQRGLLEFSLRIERALPGLWSRLALLLPATVRPQLQPDVVVAYTLRERDRRCWLMCMAQAYQINLDNS